MNGQILMQGFTENINQLGSIDETAYLAFYGCPRLVNISSAGGHINVYPDAYDNVTNVSRISREL